MNAFPPDIRFRKPWRSYQQRVLAELEQHLDDNHLHVITAPGSGKTVLGLEVVRRLNRPTLVLAPTVAIRDQWIDRFVGLFMDPAGGTPPWMSKDIRSPRFFTASTYQGLHSVYTGEPEDESTEDAQAASRIVGRDSLRARLQELGVRTLVLDEAHHLRNEWWKCLADLTKHLAKPTVVSLTATAPFDVSPFEWERYIGLCGPIENPRYVLARKTPLGWLMRKDYHAVPQMLARNKELAEHFRKMWARYVGPTELVYTRTPEGRSFLLKARAHSIAQAFQRRAERLRSWQ
jgi:superfamily II DNA or RNA helicase